MAQAEQLREPHDLLLAPGQKVMWYEVEEVLDSDAFGTTYRARNTRDGASSSGESAPVVAIRELLPRELAVRGDFSEVQVASQADAGLFASARARFVDEARKLSDLDHPAIVQVHFQRRMNATAYMVMEYLDGRSLRQAMDDISGLDEAILIELFSPVMDALALAHSRGLLHANLSPQSVWLRDDGTLVLTGFGAAQLAYLRALQEPLLGLSAGYAALEQYSEQAGDQGPWTDVHGLAAVLYRIVTGYRPADALERVSVPAEEGDDQPSALQLARGRYSDTFLAAIDAALSVAPHARPQSMASFKARLLGVDEPRAAAGRVRAVKPDPAPRMAAPLEADAVSEERSTPAAGEGGAAQSVDDVLFGRGGSRPSPPPDAFADQDNGGTGRTAGASAMIADLRDTAGEWGSALNTRTRVLFQSLVGGTMRGLARLRHAAAGALQAVSGFTPRVRGVTSLHAAPNAPDEAGPGQASAGSTEPAGGGPAAGAAVRSWLAMLEQRSGWKAVHVAAVGGLVVVLLGAAGMLASLLPVAPTDVQLQAAGGSAAQVASAPDVRSRHYARVERLLDEARVALETGDIDRARYLAETSLALRPQFEPARAFLDTLR